MFGIGLEYLIPIVSPLGFSSFGLRFVQEGELGIKLRFGKAVSDKDGTPLVVKPGFIILIPFVDRLQKRHVRQQTIQLDEQDITLSDNLIFRVGGMVIFRVINVYRAQFEIENLRTAIETLSAGILRERISAMKHVELREAPKLSEDFLKELRVKSTEWGVEFLDFRICSCAPTQETAHIITAKSAVEQRVAALKEAARQLDYATVREMPGSLAAALVGVPVVTAITEPKKQAAAGTYNDTDNSKHLHFGIGTRHYHEISNGAD